jgi:hypothetical protein
MMKRNQYLNWAVQLGLCGVDVVCAFARRRCATVSLRHQQLITSLLPGHRNNLGLFPLLDVAKCMGLCFSKDAKMLRM